MNYVMTVLSLIFTSTASVTEGVTEPMRSQVVADFVELLIEAGTDLGMTL